MSHLVSAHMKYNVTLQTTHLLLMRIVVRVNLLVDNPVLQCTALLDIPTYNTFIARFVYETVVMYVNGNVYNI